MPKIVPLSRLQWKVVYLLQKQLRESGSHAQISEDAINLALSPKRSTPSVSLLLRNVKRDAERTLRRRAEARQIEPFPDDDTSLAPELQSSDPGPEEYTIASDLEGQIRDRVRLLDPNAELCLEGMIAGEEVAQTAARLKISQRRVKYLRKRIRSVTKCICPASNDA